MTKTLRLVMGTVAILVIAGAVIYVMARPGVQAEPNEPPVPTGLNGDQPPSYSRAGKIVDLYIVDTTAPAAVSPLSRDMVDAMQVSENPDGPFYSSTYVYGLDYEPGFRYHVRAENRPSDPGIMDVPGYSYLIVEIVDKQRVN